MNKNDLKEKWGQYIDTDKLVDDIQALLTKYHHKNTEHGVCVMLNEFFCNKEPLIKLFQKSENYIGDLRILRHEEFDREGLASEISSFCYTFSCKVHAEEKICKTTDEEGKTIRDYLLTGKSFLRAEDLLEDTWSEKQISEFCNNGITKKSREAYIEFCEFIKIFRYITSSTLSPDNVCVLSGINPSIKFAEGLKTSRAFNRVCAKYGITGTKAYNREFAKYSDMVSGLSRKLDYVISLNPYDYLTMSFGNSWESCHTIDKTNQRNMPNSYSGGYCGGTLSYMLDTSSIITYCVSPGENVQTSGKIYRNMFHCSDGLFIQGRVYPQGNDGSVNLYEKFRRFMQDEMSKLLGLENNHWTHKTGTEACGNRTSSTGVHYKDYQYYSDCTVFYPTEKKEIIPSRVRIGHVGICVKCGEPIHDEARIFHYDC